MWVLDPWKRCVAQRESGGAKGPAKPLCLESPKFCRLVTCVLAVDLSLPQHSQPHLLPISPSCLYPGDDLVGLWNSGLSVLPRGMCRKLAKRRTNPLATTVAPFGMLLSSIQPSCNHPVFSMRPAAAAPAAH